jgi:hypothetical protein
MALGLSLNSFAEIDAHITLSDSAKAPNLYPTAMLERPFTMPTNSFETGIKFKVDPAQMSVNSLHLDYGITDDFQIGLSWNGMGARYNFSDFKAENALSLNLGYFLFANRYAASMVALSSEFLFDSRVASSTSLSAPTSIPIIRGHLAFLAFYNDLVKMDWQKNAAEFHMPLKLNWQATPRLYIGLETHLGKLSTDGNHDYIGKTSPAWFNGLYAITPAVDVMTKIGFNEVTDQNTFGFVVGINIRGGMLDG